MGLLSQRHYVYRVLHLNPTLWAPLVLFPRRLQRRALQGSPAVFRSVFVMLCDLRMILSCWRWCFKASSHVGNNRSSNYKSSYFVEDETI